MKSLILAFLLATATMAQAQQLNQSQTIKLHNKATGEFLGTATKSGNTVYIRNKNGEHIYTTILNPNGTKTTFDPSGNVINPPEQ